MKNARRQEDTKTNESARSRADRRQFRTKVGSELRADTDTAEVTKTLGGEGQSKYSNALSLMELTF